MGCFASILQGLLFFLSLSAGEGASAEGTEFALALPFRGTGIHGDSEIQISSNQGNATVHIYGASYNESVVVGYQSSQSIILGEEWYVDGGIETKVFYVNSDLPVHITNSQMELLNNRNPDSVLYFSKRKNVSGNMLFILPGVPGKYNDNVHGGYYSVASYEDNTDVEVLLLQSDGSWVAEPLLILHKYQVFTRFVGQDDTFGTVTSTKPVSVGCGHNRVELPHDYGTAPNQHPYDSVPPVELHGTEYISVPVQFSHPNAGYMLRVSCSENNTRIEIPEVHIDVNKDAGEYLEFDGALMDVLSDTALLVTCSTPCQVFQYIKAVYDGIAEDQLLMGTCMVPLSPISVYVDELFFSTPQILEAGQDEYKGNLVITVSNKPVGDLFLNGENLKNHPDWKEVHGGDFSYLTLELTPGQHYIHTENEENLFTAYLYITNILSAARRALALNLGYGKYQGLITTTPAVPATSSPVAMYPVPPYKLTLNGVFESDDGDEFSPGCTERYSSSLSSMALDQMDATNDMIGDQLCYELSSGDLELKISNALFITNENLGATSLSYHSVVQGYLSLQQHYNCVDEITGYLANHSNWVDEGDPLLAPEPGCPEVKFNSTIFSDGRTGADWLCPASQSDEEISHEDPWHHLEISDNFTVLGEPLDIPCVSQYSTNWQNEVIKMAVSLSQNVAAGELCLGQAGLAQIVMRSTQFTAQATQGSIKAMLHVEALNNSVTFDGLGVCTEEVFDALEHHESWPSSPVIPEPPGCSQLDYGEEMFWKESSGWMCPEISI